MSPRAPNVLIDAMHEAVNNEAIMSPELVVEVMQWWEWFMVSNVDAPASITVDEIHLLTHAFASMFHRTIMLTAEVSRLATIASGGTP